MTLYLTAAPDRLAQARAATAQLAHAAYRIGLGSQLLAAPLPAALRGGLMVVSDRQAPAVEQPEPLARQLVRVCLRRGFSGIVLDLEELPDGRWAEDRGALIRQLDGLRPPPLCAGDLRRCLAGDGSAAVYRPLWR